MAVGVLGVPYVLDPSTGAWKARGRPPIGGAPTSGGGGSTSRSSLQIEVDRPVRDVNCGVLTDVARPNEIRPTNQGEHALLAGQVLRDAVVYGTLYMPSGSQIHNVRVLGSPPDASPGVNSHKPLVRTPSGATGVLIEDCTLQPSAANESDQVYGIKGRGFTLRRSVVARCVDTMQVWNGSATVEQSWLGDPYLRNPDRTRSDGQATHNDNPQLQGGGGTILFRGNTLDSWISNFATWIANGNSPSIFNLLVTRDVGSAPERVRFWGNWIRGGTYPINVSTAAAAVSSGGWVEASFLRNRIEKGQTKDAGGDGWHAIAHTTNVQPHWQFPGSGADANTDYTVSTDRTTWTATGNAIRVRAG